MKYIEDPSKRSFVMTKEQTKLTNDIVVAMHKLQMVHQRLTIGAYVLEDNEIIVVSDLVS